jgi:hypothetical protein
MVLGAGIISTWLGKDLNWDLLNYHFYNPWAFLHGRLSTDLYPAQLQTFYNPFIDLPFYVLTQILPDYAVVFLMGIPLAVAAFALWELLDLCTSATRSIPNILNQVSACILAFSGAAGLSVMNTTTGDFATTAILILGLWAVVASEVGRLGFRQAMATAGLLLGSSAGLKLTEAVPVAAISIALPIVSRWKSSRNMLAGFLLYATCGAIGFIFFAGPWMAVLYAHYHNPFYPYFGDIFGSSLLSQQNMRDTRFVAGNFFDAVVFPLRAAATINSLHSELPLRDPRLLIGGIVSAIWAFYAIKSVGADQQSDKRRNLKLFISIIFMINYTLSIFLFGIYRYMLVLEILSMVMICISIDECLQYEKRLTAVTIAALAYGAAILLTVAPNWGRTQSNGDRYFPYTPAIRPRGSVIVNMTSFDTPVGYLVPLWPGHPPFYSPMTNLSRPGVNGLLQRQIDHAVFDHAGHVYVLRDGNALSTEQRYLLEKYQLSIVDASCRPIENANNHRFAICSTEADPMTWHGGFDVTHADRRVPFPGGWFPLDSVSSGVWIGKTASLNFPASAAKTGRDLIVEGYAPVSLLLKGNPGTTFVSISVAVNGRIVTTAHLSEDAYFQISVPSTKVEGQVDKLPVIAVDVTCSADVVPRKIGVGPDVRELSLLIRKVDFSE